MHLARGASLLALVLCSAAGCHSPGPYGHSTNYAPSSDEATAIANAREYDPVMFTRRPDEWRKGMVVLFGVVETRAPGSGGSALLKLSVRHLEPRNVCQNEKDEDTCRVTVSDKDYGVLYALVALHGEDDVGPSAVGAKSLVRVVGKIGEDISASDGAPILHASYARHWPQYQYVTKASR
jgi:hypothetical protein